MRRGAPLAMAITSVLVGIACYGPTEVRVDITTDQPCFPANPLTGDKRLLTAVTLGAARGAVPETEVENCTERAGADTDIGSIVIVPSGDRDARVTVQVSMTTNGRPNKDCIVAEEKSPPAYCILARRSFSFIEHTSRVLPIKLYGDCRGVRCPIGETCGRGGGCRSDVVGDVDPVLQDEPCIGPKCVPGADGDAGADADADADAPALAASCAAQDGSDVVASVDTAPSDLLAGNSTHLFWSGGKILGTSVSYVPKKGGTVQTFASEYGTVTAVAADDTYLWFGTLSFIVRMTLGAPTPTFDKWTSDPVEKIALLAGTTYVTTRSLDMATRSLHLLENGGAPEILDQATGSTDLAVSNAYAYGVDLDAQRFYRHALPWSAAGPRDNLPVANGSARFVTSVPGMAFFSAGPPQLGPTLPPDKPGIYRVVDGVNEVEHVVAVDDPWNIASNGTAVFYVVRTPKAAVYRLPLGGTVGEKITADFGSVRGLVASAGCVYFWSRDSKDDDSKLHVSDMTPKP